MNYETSPRSEAWMGILLVLFGFMQVGGFNKVTWHHGAPMDPWQSKFVFGGFVLIGTFLLAHAIVRKLK